MAAGVLVVEGVIKEQAALADGRVLADQGALAQAAGVLVGCEDVLEHLAPLRRTEIDHAATLETEPEVAHDLAAVDEGQSGVHDAVGAQAVRRGEHLLRGHVGKVDRPVHGTAGTALPDAAWVETDREVGAVGRAVMQVVVFRLVEQALVLLEGGVVGLPGALGVVAVRAGDREDRDPEAVDGLAGREVREDLTGPGLHRHAGDAPDVAAEIHAVAEGLALGVARTAGSRGLGGVDAAQGVGVRTLQEEERGARLGEGVELLDLPARRLLEPGEVHILIIHAGDLVVGPDHRHMGGARGIGGTHDATGEIGPLDRGLDDELLARLDRGAHTDDEVGIAVDLVRERRHGAVALLVGHRYRVFHLSPSLARRMPKAPVPKGTGPEGPEYLSGAGNGIRTRG